MTKYTKQIISVVSAGTMLLSLATPALADSEIVISGNGATSTNFAQVSQTNTTAVSQSNTANVTNNVSSNANSGGNTANFNTGGSVGIGTGAASSTTNVANNLNSNAAAVNGCACDAGVNVKISDNGAGSKNTAAPITVVNSTSLGQTNTANVTNNVGSNSNSGGNTANLNTGGTVMIGTGPASSTSNVKTTANSNSASLGGATAGALSPSASFVIAGNGAGSQNFITATLVNASQIGQTNSANITNDVVANANSGKNDASFNTGGTVMVGTGAASSTVGVDNMVNFNVANTDCGCLMDTLGKIVDNGATSLNTLALTLSNSDVLGQGNGATLRNNAGANSDSGSNTVNLNTGGVHTDPSIMTGPATNNTNVNNSGNVNTVGTTPLMVTLPGGSTVGVSFNLQALLAFFGVSIV